MKMHRWTAVINPCYLRNKYYFSLLITNNSFPCNRTGNKNNALEETTRRHENVTKEKSQTDDPLLQNLVTCATGMIIVCFPCMPSSRNFLSLALLLVVYTNPYKGAKAKSSSLLFKNYNNSSSGILINFQGYAK